MSVTTKDIARICGVSRTTVDRALNNKSRINPKTKEKILSVSKELGYQPDLLARSLVKGKTMCIGVVTFDIRNRYFAQMLNSIEIDAKSKGYFINITLHENDRALEKELISRLLALRVDGILICPVNKGKAFEGLLEKLPIPVVTIGNYVSDKIPFVGIDEKKAASEATKMILSKGYERVVFVCPPLIDQNKENIYTHEQRVKGFMEAMKNFSQVESTVIGDWDYLNKVREISKRLDKKTAFFCSGDIYALNIMKDLKKLNLYIPRDIGIMGFDSIDTLDYVSPQMATVYNSIQEVSTTAVDTLVLLMEGKPVPKKSIIDYKIIEGESL